MVIVWTETSPFTSTFKDETGHLYKLKDVPSHFALRLEDLIYPGRFDAPAETSNRTGHTSNWNMQVAKISGNQRSAYPPQRLASSKIFLMRSAPDVSASRR